MTVSGTEASLVASLVGGNSILIHNLATAKFIYTCYAPFPHMDDISLSHDGTGLCMDHAGYRCYYLDLTSVTGSLESTSGNTSKRSAAWKELEMDSQGWHLGLSADGSGVLTTSGFVPLQTREDRDSPLSEQHAEQRKTSAQTQLPVDYYFSDGWLWRVDRGTAPRRVCWLPPLYKEIVEGRRLPRSHMATDHQAIAFKTKEARFVVLDLSRCYSKRCKSVCTKQHAQEAYECHDTASS